MSWLIDTLLVTGALIALVLILRRPVARLFGPGMAYALWLLPLLRLVLPPLVLPAPEQAPMQVVTAIAVPLGAPQNAPSVDWVAVLTPWLIGLWLGGAVVFLAMRLIGYARMRRSVMATAQDVGRHGTVRLVESAAVQIPGAFGVADKVVALPVGFMAGPDRTARDLAIAHELEHHAGRDLAVNFAMQPLLALHWFNPLAWLGWRALRRDQEAACDARVLADCDGTTRTAYAQLIAAWARHADLSAPAPMACAVMGEKSIIFRLRSLNMTQPTTRRRRAGRLLIGAGALALPLTASISYAAGDEPPVSSETKPAIREEHRVVIIERESKGGKEDAKLKTKVIEKEGKTFVFKTDKNLSDAEMEAHMAKAMAAVPPVPPVPGETRRIMVFSGDSMQISGLPDHSVVKVMNGDKPGAEMVTVNGKAIAEKCGKDAIQSNAEASETTTDGKTKVMRFKFCSVGDVPAKAIEGMRNARDRIAKDERLSPAIRDSILKQLDSEIERLSKQG